MSGKDEKSNALGGGAGAPRSLDADLRSMQRACRIFCLSRDKDVSGVSGLGIVAAGVVFPDGTCALRWLTEHRSTAIYANLDDVWAIHGHEGNTRLVFGPVLE